jgi:anthranilate/para-aminobenzoate synthase component I
VQPERLVAAFDRGPALVWSDPAGPGGGPVGFLGWPRSAQDVLLLDGDGRVSTMADEEGGRLGGLDQLAVRLREGLTGRTTRSSRFGWWGVLGYEAGARACGVPVASGTGPQAAFVQLDRGIEVDRAARRLTLLADAARADAAGWLERTAGAIEELSRRDADPPAPGPASGHVRWRHDRAAYLDLIARCTAAIRRGDAYQLCLTNALEVDLPDPVDPIDVYRRLRVGSAARHGGVLRIGDRWLLSGSPEQLLSVDRDGRARTSPIKGTRARHRDGEADRALADELAADVKERAENVMIVDLCRNDLSRVSRVGSVEVTRLLEVESYPAVHQLVSTVEADLTGDAVAACLALFPAGSMTGAPKRSAMSILSGLEAGPRGLYAGAWGRFGTDGSADLAVVIRSIVIEPGRATVGTGGGITILSDPAAEWAEILVKARPMLAALGASWPST